MTESIARSPLLSKDNFLVTRRRVQDGFIKFGTAGRELNDDSLYDPVRPHPRDVGYLDVKGEEMTAVGLVIFTENLKMAV